MSAFMLALLAGVLLVADIGLFLSLRQVEKIVDAMLEHARRSQPHDPR